MRRAYWILVAVVLLLIPVAVLRGQDLIALRVQSLQDKSFIGSLEMAASDTFSGQRWLRGVNVELHLLGGRQVQNDIFISQDGLIKNIDAASPTRIQENIDAILRFAEKAEVPTYLTLLPTSCAVLQQKLPPYAEIRNNQRQLIDDVYSQMVGKVTTMDVYPLLFNQREEYIYYRTENNFTALGGYYIYSVIGPRLLGTEVSGLSQYNVSYIREPFYGDLYNQSPYSGVEPDILSQYHYTQYGREYMVQHSGSGGAKNYYTLYPRHLAELGSPMEVYFGGISAVTRIRTSTPSGHSLLIFGDRTALSFVPFLSNYYQEITVVDLFQVTAAQAEGFQVSDFEQVLFAYSVETFDTNIPLRAENLL